MSLRRRFRLQPRLAWGLLAVLLLAGAAAAQQGPQSQQTPPAHHPPAGSPSLYPPLMMDTPSSLPAAMQARMRYQQAQINARKIRQESAQLLALSRQLQLMLAHSSANVLPVQALKKVEKIEQLAKQLRSRLRRGGIQPPSS